MTGKTTVEKETNNENKKDSPEELGEYLERLSRTTPTTMPEWMN
jgi:hypothetical protein